MFNQEEIKNISEILERIANTATGEIMNDYAQDLKSPEDDIRGFETEMTGSIRTKINESLLDSLKKELDNNILGRYLFKVQTFKGKGQEPFVGADILGKLEIEICGQSILKYFLVQSKVAKTTRKGLTFGDSNMLRQANLMLTHTPDSFFFLYNKGGIKVVSAFMIKLLKRRTLSTSLIGHKTFGQFYTDHFNCFIGDNRHWQFTVNPGILPSDFVQYIIDIKITKNQ